MVFFAQQVINSKIIIINISFQHFWMHYLSKKNFKAFEKKMNQNNLKSGSFWHKHFFNVLLKKYINAFFLYFLLPFFCQKRNEKFHFCFKQVLKINSIYFCLVFLQICVLSLMAYWFCNQRCKFSVLSSYHVWKQIAYGCVFDSMLFTRHKKENKDIYNFI